VTTTRTSRRLGEVGIPVVERLLGGTIIKDELS
jgi:hypothetical protein